MRGEHIPDPIEEVRAMDDLDEAAKRAVGMLRYLRERYEEETRPYIRLLADIEAMRPRIYYVDGKTMVPFLPAADARRT